jgi:hypothetical protein
MAIMARPKGSLEMRFFCFVFALALLGIPASAQDKQDPDSQSSTSVVVNGQPLKGKYCKWMANILLPSKT